MKKFIICITFILFGLANIYLGYTIKSSYIDTNILKSFFSNNEKNIPYIDIIIGLGALQTIIGIIIPFTGKRKYKSNYKS